MPRRRDHSPRILALTATTALWGLHAPTAALAQDNYVAEANQIHRPGAGQQDAAEPLLKALGSMDAPPASIPDAPTALLMRPGDDGWDEALAWATAPNQRAVLSTLREVTNPGDPHVFSLPYGLDNTPPALADTGLAIDLGEPPLLAGANFVYLDALDELFALVSIDAARLAEDNDGEAAYRLIQWIRLARMVADQPMSVEKSWAIHSMRLGVMRLLDVFALHPELMDEREIVRLVRELSEDEIRVERILPPSGDRTAMEELVAATYTERRGPNPATFGPVLARLMSGGQPLGLFGEASYFQQVARQQANWFDTTEKVEAIYNDWEARWSVPQYEYIWTQQMERRLIDPARYTLIEHFSPDLYPMIQDRLALRADLAGARMAISVIGYRRGKGVWPSDLAAIRPTFVDNIDTDPYDDGGDRNIKQFEILEYFVPIRDQKFGPREDPHPHRIRVYRAGGIFAGLESQPVAIDRDAVDGAIGVFMATLSSQSRNAFEGVFDQIAQGFIELGLTRANYGDKVRGDTDGKIKAMLVPAQTSALMQDVATRAGVPSELSDEDYQDVMLEELRVLFDNNDFTAGLGIVRRGERLSPEVAQAGLRAVLEAGAQSMITLVRKLQPSSFGPDHFDIELDDHNFVIFARGIDRRADWAREVGPGAADYLIWPPVLTLLRSELRGERPMAAWDND
ncbi:MAG: hypothetical protein H6814_11165 [Phycisphaeraceae bacterium]|nr:hypothetical protein [Phycisphaeraceae bacterium]